MKRIFYLLVLTLISVSSMAKVVDLSGTWSLNKSKSTINDEFSMAPSKLILAQNINVLAVERHESSEDGNITRNEKFTLDGKECINDGEENSKEKSVAVWSADEKSLTITTKIPMQDEEMTTIETYQLEGNNLKIVVKTSSSFGDSTETLLFDKL